MLSEDTRCCCCVVLDVKVGLGLVIGLGGHKTCSSFAMDALIQAYDDRDEEEEEHESYHQQPQKRPKFVSASPLSLPPPLPLRPHSQPPLPPTSAGVPGRYVSKRERAAIAATALAPNPTSPVRPPLELASVLNAKLPHRIQRKLDHSLGNAGGCNRCPRELVTKLEGHSKAVIAVRWSPTHGALLASAGMDHKAYVWNVWESPAHQMGRCLSCHTHALKDIQWSLDGNSVLSCGFDQTARLSDVETGAQTQVSFCIVGIF